MQSTFTFVCCSLMVISSAGVAQELPCHLRELQLVGRSIEVRFAPKADWNVKGHALSPNVYLRAGELVHIPDDEDPVQDIGPIQLKHGESVVLYEPHHSCTLQAVIGKISTGLIVQQGFAHPGIRLSSDYDFIPVAKQP